MVRSVLRSTLAVVLALVVALALVIAIEVLSNVFHPFPAGVDPADLEACKAHVANYPAWLLAVAGLGWGLTVFVSSWVATRLGAGRHPAHGIAIGLLLFAAAAFNMSMLPYPLWFEAGTVILFVAAILFAVQLGRRRIATTAAV
jgi:hypothetical protein